MQIIDINNNKRDCIKVSLDKGYPGYVKVDFKSKIRKDYQYSEWYPINKFITKNPKFKDKFGKLPQKPKEDLGIVSKSTKNSLQDNSKNWPKNLYAGYPLWISRGKGEGQQRTVVKNTKNTLYIDKDWKTKPDKTSQYVLSRNVQKHIKSMGNVLPELQKKKIINDIIKKAKKSAISKAK